MFGPVFRPHSLVWNILNTITDILGLSILWLICSVPVFTIGAATTALYDAAVHGIRYKEEGTYRRFFKTFRSEFLTGTLFTLLWGTIIGVGVFLFIYISYASQANDKLAVFSGVYLVVLLFPLSVFCWSSAILSRFTHKFGSLTATALKFLVVHFFASAAIGVVTALSIWVSIEYIRPLAFLPAVNVLIWSLVAEPIFRKYGGGLDVFREPEELPESEEDSDNNS